MLKSGGIEALTGWARETIRKDLSCLNGEAAGSAGGYRAQVLIPALKRALGLDSPRRYCIVGLGRLGSALLNEESFARGEFELAAGFDTNVNRVEILGGKTPLYPSYKMSEVISRLGIAIAILCVPREAAQSAAEKLAAAGIQGILNFTPRTLTLPAAVTVRNLYVADGLRSLAVAMGRREKD
jgi:redox-sensing transcriptional repressor